MSDSNHPNEIILSVEQAQTMWRDRRRYFKALKTFLKIENSYKRLHEKVANLAPEDRQHLLCKLHRRNAQLLYQLCETNGGMWIKCAQFLCSYPDILPNEYIAQFQHLHSNSHSLPFLHLEVVLVEEWGANWEHYFDWIEEEPVATTAIAQIHKAKLVNGPEVAVKIQLPDAQRCYQQDALQLKALAKILASRLPQFNLPEITNDLLYMTEQALDFTHEKENLEQFAQLPHMRQISTPKLFASWSTKRVLMTEWIAGETFTHYIRSSESDDLQQYLITLQESYLQQITQFGFYHTHLQPHHFLVSAERGIIYILDCVTMSHLSTAQRVSYHRLLFTIFTQDCNNLGSALNDAEFKDVNQELIEKLTKILSSNDENNSPYQLLHLLLRELNRHQVEVPESFRAIARVLLSLDSLIGQFNAPVVWQNVFSEAG